MHKPTANAGEICGDYFTISPRLRDIETIVTPGCLCISTCDSYDPFSGSAQVRIVSTSAACNVTEAGAKSSLQFAPRLSVHGFARRLMGLQHEISSPA